MAKRFALKAQSDLANIWVEAGEIRNENVTEAQIDALEDALLNETPEGSIDPSQGIITNDNDVFGEPPNYDGDGKVDVLLYDITEGVEEDGCCVLGYVIGTDINPRARPNEGNQRDVLYLDTDPGVTSGNTATLLSTAAHEYQHLIHFNYDLGEETFINEGFSEWAEILNGYAARDISYLGDAAELNTQLFTWRTGEPISVLTQDYQRAGLFTTYLAEQVGAEAAGSVVRSMIRFGGSTRPARGTEGYDAVLVPLGTSLADIIADFHTANYLNDRSIEPRFGYETGQYRQVKAVRANIVDGRTSSSPSTPVTSGLVSPGAVQYLIWEQVDDLKLDFDVDGPAQQITELRNSIRPRVVLNRGGAITVQDIAAREDPYLFSGPYTRITLVIPHVDPEDDALTPFTYAASWGDQQQFAAETVNYDDGSTAQDSTGALEVWALGEAFRYANRFEVPEEGVLSSVAVAPYYRNQFSNFPDVPDDAPRNFTLKVWDVAEDGGPGQELLPLVIYDSRLNSSENLNFLDIPLGEYEDRLSDLPSAIFIGLENTGTDENYLVLGVSEYDEADVSYLYLPDDDAWAPFSGVTSNNKAVFEDRVIPIRATFLVPEVVAVEEGAPEVPDRVELDGNYPNPFNPATTIAYRLPHPAEVRLSVYDALGRRVATLLDGAVQQAGPHEVAVEASAWPSGLYLYRLEAAGQARTGKMMLVK